MSRMFDVLVEEVTTPIVEQRPAVLEPLIMYKAANFRSSYLAFGQAVLNEIHRPCNWQPVRLAKLPALLRVVTSPLVLPISLLDASARQGRTAKRRRRRHKQSRIGTG